MRKPKLTSDEIKITVEKPDLVTNQCDEHRFYIKNIEDKGQLIVYAKKTDEKKYSIQCADWLLKYS
jgi:hypothetical protein